jgi:hypothetical protein
MRIWLGSSVQPARAMRSPKVSSATMNGVVSSDFSFTSTTSYCVTWKEGMLTFLPLTRKWPCETIWRAWRRGAGGEAGAVDHVVQAALEELQQVVTGLAGSDGSPRRSSGGTASRARRR